MDIFWATFQSIGVLLGIGLLGFFIIGRKIVPVSILDVLSPLVIRIALPAMVFTDIITRFEPAQLPNWWRLPLLFLAGMAVLLVLSLVSARFLGGRWKHEFAISLFYPNIIFVPLVMIPGVYGPNTPLLIELFLFTLFFPVLLFNFSASFFPGGEKAVKKGPGRFINPVLVLTLAALVLKLSGFYRVIPDFVFTITRQVGSLAMPLIMILIGGNIFVDFQKRGEWHVPDILRFILVKNFLFPAVALAALAFLRLPSHESILLLLLSAMPPVTSVPVFTARANGNESITNQFLITSFLTALISIPASIKILHLFIPMP